MFVTPGCCTDWEWLTASSQITKGAFDVEPRWVICLQSSGWEKLGFLYSDSCLKPGFLNAFDSCDFRVTHDDLNHAETHGLHFFANQRQLFGRISFVLAHMSFCRRLWV